MFETGSRDLLDASAAVFVCCPSLDDDGLLSRTVSISPKDSVDGVLLGSFGASDAVPCSRLLAVAASDDLVLPDVEYPGTDAICAV